jgi:hypothetical protein
MVDRAVRYAAREDRVLEVFRPTLAERAARIERDWEERRRVQLMKDHSNEPGTTDVCRCGFIGYSTPGYLLHLYDTIKNDTPPTTCTCGLCQTQQINTTELNDGWTTDE